MNQSNKYLYTCFKASIIFLVVTVILLFHIQSSEVDTPHVSVENHSVIYSGLPSSIYIEVPKMEVIEDEPYLELTDEEIHTFAVLLYLEGGIESRECQEAIASVIVNRMTNYDMSLDEVVYQKNQFEPACKISKTKLSDEDLEEMKSVITKILEEGPTIPEYVTYFRAGHYHRWSKRIVPYVYIDHTYFSYDIELYNRYQTISDGEYESE